MEQSREGTWKGSVWKSLEEPFRLTQRMMVSNAAGKKTKTRQRILLHLKIPLATGGDRNGGSFGVTEGAYIRISGGDVKINASGDGIDSNGDLYLEGGTVLVEGPAGGGDGALDYDGEGSISGGTMIGA